MAGIDEARPSRPTPPRGYPIRRPFVVERYRRRLLEIGNPLVADPAAWAAHARWAQLVVADCFEVLDGPARLDIAMPCGDEAGGRGPAIDAAGAGADGRDEPAPALDVELPRLAEAGSVLFAVVMDMLGEAARHGLIETCSVTSAGAVLQQAIARWLALEGARRGTCTPRDAHQIEAEIRREVAREVHDRIGGSVYLAMRQLELFQLLSGSRPEAAGVRIEAVRAALVQLSADTRSLVTDLREHRLPGSLEEALRTFVESLALSDIAVDLRVEGEQDAAPAELLDAVFMIVRECLRNSLNHSAATTVSVRVKIEPTEVKAQVQDDGTGFDLAAAEASGLANGLAGMRERVARFGGTHRITSRPAQGTSVIVSIPIRRCGSELKAANDSYYCGG